MPVTIGTDPEAFVVESDGTVGIAIGKVGGSKEQPLLVEGGAVQEDNVLAEFNTEPATTPDAFVGAIAKVVQQLEQRIKPFGLSLLFKPSHEYDEFDLEIAGPQAMQFGCDPDYNAWTYGKNPAPSAEGGLRTAGGHVHIGYDLPTDTSSLRIIRACDILMGIPSVVLDTDNRRRSLYGGAGAHRIKEYGVEYRVLSNFWLQSDALKRWVHEQATAAVTWGPHVDRLIERAGGAEHIQRIINTGDVEDALEVIHRLTIAMPEGWDD
jgi:hypothetical protein